MCPSADVKNTSIDIENAIAPCSASPGASLLKLPHHRNEPRDQMSELLERQPESACESFASDDERCSHVLKKAELLPLGKSSGPFERLPSTSANTSGDDDTSSMSSVSSVFPSSLVLAPGLQMRNTSAYESQQADEHNAQSLQHRTSDQPSLAEHGGESIRGVVFAHGASRNIQSSTSVGKTSIGLADPSPTPLVSIPFVSAASGALDIGASQNFVALAPGSQVVIEGLLQLPAFNGLSGILQSFEADSGRYAVLLASPCCGHTVAKVKRENLRATIPPPASHPPTLLLDFWRSTELSPPMMPPTPVWDDEARPMWF